MMIPTYRELLPIVQEFMEIEDNPPRELRLDCHASGWHISRRPWGPTYGIHCTLPIPIQSDLSPIEVAMLLTTALIKGVRQQVMPTPADLEVLTEMFAEAGLSYTVREKLDPETRDGDTWVTIENPAHFVHFVFKNDKLENMGVEQK